MAYLGKYEMDRFKVVWRGDGRRDEASGVVGVRVRAGRLVED